jgi:hypothetical protein
VTEAETETSSGAQILDLNWIFMAVLQELLILLTFGVVAPLLGLIVASSLFTRCLRWHCVASDALRRGGLEATTLAHNCRGLGREKANPLFSAHWFLILFSSVFLAFYLVDTAGDAVGMKYSLWAPLLMIAAPTSLSLARDWCLRRRDRHTAAESKSHTGVEMKASTATETATETATAATPSPKQNQVDDDDDVRLTFVYDGALDARSSSSGRGKRRCSRGSCCAASITKCYTSSNT